MQQIWWKEETHSTISAPSHAPSVAKTGWWEMEAQKVAQSTNSLKDLRLIHQIVPFKNKNTLYLALSKQERLQLKGLWTIVCNEPVLHEGRGAEEMAEDIVEGLGQEPAAPYHEVWCPPEGAEHLMPNAYVANIAANLDQYFNNRLLNIPQKDWISGVLGYEAASVTRFLESARNSRTVLRGCVQKAQCRTNGTTTIKQKIEMRLRDLNPVARWVAMDAPGSHPEEALQPLTRYFRAVSTQKRDDLMCWVKEIAVMARLLYKNIGSTHVDWSKDYSSGANLLHQIDSKDLVTLAWGVKWQTICDNVWACVVVDNELGKPLGEFAKQLLMKRKFSFTIAFLAGLDSAGVHPTEIAHLFEIIRPDNNQANYRAQDKKKGAIPFVLLHILRLKYNWSRRREESEEPEKKEEQEEQEPRHVSFVRGLGECFASLSCVRIVGASI